MGRLDEQILDQLGKMISEGDNLVGVCSTSEGHIKAHLVVNVASWVSRCGHLIKSVSEEDSVYYEQYREALKQPNFYNIHSHYCNHIAHILGIIISVRQDFNEGLLVNVRRLLRAEIFGDFLEMADYLLSQNYKDSSAVLIGAVLEDSLRKLAIKNRIPVTKDDRHKTIEPLNQELAKAGVYDKLIQKQISSWGDLRNRAAHGHFDSYDIDQVRMMLLFVEKFCSDYLS